MNGNAGKPAPHESPLPEPPFVDEHTRLIDASVTEVWAALTAHLAASNNRSTNAYASLVGAHPRRGAGEFPRHGATLAGFAVSQGEPPHQLTLTGEHRFSRYTMTFLLEPHDEGTVLHARSHAEFPDFHGQVYRLAVIGSGAHRTLVQQLLRSVGRRALKSQANDPAARKRPLPHRRRPPRDRPGLRP